MRLPVVSVDNSVGESPPIVLLHGFGGMAMQWSGLQIALSFAAPTLAFDMPGHGGAINYPQAGPPIVAARAVIQEMEERGIQSAHLVGHSMGGAIASLMALIDPDRVDSLTLLAPGGYGEEFNHPALMKWASARTLGELSAIMKEFFSPGFEMPHKFAEFQFEIRKRSGLVEKLTEIASGMAKNGKQGVLPINDVLSGDYNVTIIWGEDDKILPVSQALALREMANVHILAGVGHSPAEEAQEKVKNLILQNIAD